MLHEKSTINTDDLSIIKDFRKIEQKTLRREAKLDNFSLCIDWFQFTILGQPIENVIKDIFGYKLDNCTLTESGLNGYNQTYTIGDKINIMHNTNRSDMGVNILMSGSACREFEEMFTWDYLIRKIKSYGVFKYKAPNYEGEKIVTEEKEKKAYQINRIDMAYDLFYDLFTVKDIQDKLDKKHVVTSFKKYQVTYEESTAFKQRLSESVTLGSKSSQLYIVFYNKLLERKNEGYELNQELDSWLRCEMRFKSDHANVLFEKMAEDFENVALFIDHTLYTYVDFKAFSKTDSNKSRWKTVTWWSEFVRTTYKLKIKKQAVTSSIVKKRRYADMNLSKFLTLITVADPNFIKEFLEKGASKIKQSDLHSLNNYFLQHNQKILNMEDFNHRILEIKKNYY